MMNKSKRITQARAVCSRPKPPGRTALGFFLFWKRETDIRPSPVGFRRPAQEMPRPDCE